MINFRKIKLSLIDIIFIILLLTGFFLRLNGFNSILYTEDGGRDFLVARHIVKYHEFPLTGPATNFESIRNSPLYFYLLSLFLFIRDNFVFLGLINLLLQVGSIAFIYLLAKKMFGGTTALAAATLFTFSQSIALHSFYLWQPWFAESFVNLSYLLLFLSYSEKSFRLLIFSIFVFMVAGVLHRSNFLLSPVFIPLVFIILKRYIIYPRKYLIIVACSLIFVILVNFPLFIYYQEHPLNLSSPALNNQTDNFWLLLKNSKDTLITNLFLINSDSKFNLDVIFLLIFGLIILAIYKYRNHHKVRNYLIILTIAIFSQMVLSSWLKTDIPRYQIPILGLFVILISAAINLVFSKNIFLNILKVLLLLYILNLTSPNLLNQITSINSSSLIPKENSNPAVKTVAREVLSIQKEESLTNLNFFNFEAIKEGNHYEYLSPAFWAFLEPELDTKLVQLDNDNSHSFRTLNNDNYIFLICYLYTDVVDEERTCKDTFAKRFKYHILEKIYSTYPFSLYISKR